MPCTGFPSVSTYVVNLTANHAGDPPIHDFKNFFNSSYVGTGLVGSHYPIAHFVLPVSVSSPYLPPAAKGRTLYWDMVAAGAPDMQGSREQTVW